MVAYRSGTVCASILTLLVLGACDAPPPGAGPAEAAGDEQCVTLAEGLYEFRDGHLLAITAAQASLSTSSGPEKDIQSGFAEMGFPWMGLKIRGRVAALTGMAPSLDAKAAALTAGEAALARTVSSGLLIVDGISVEGGERGVGEGLVALAETGASLASCQRAFNATMIDHSVLFESGNARISPASSGLLDALAGVATLCQGFVTEIGEHTSARGGDDYNLKLSQDRADAVKTYLISKGVPEDGLTSVGFGETRPLDAATTPEAYERNRRTEFKVIAR
ncbi:OmpA family protein [Hyphomonas sp.]|uniref:OmpA family protein n=1 Tax=Hyphomonas sp. TaxID=87 RepID=UPI001D4FF48A|nr:OmpA family protein [Hyphomonas sp.]MBU3920129.1 OmpA family protein [Alphaproteobacteria bacterium]MBU4063036.1 OmpA family protein [Alphaproteobacteria bacterium]MBU4163617.1 OmpA family protein [Alphaproteobacteria bacterium]